MPDEAIVGATSERSETDSVMSRALVALVSLCAGITVANLYLTQPLLPLVAQGLGVSPSKVGFLPTVAQAGYAAGLLFLVPLGDLLWRRRLLGALLTGVTASLLAAAASPTMAVLVVATLLASAFTVVPQVLIPLAARMAPEGRRGSVMAAIGASMITGLFASRGLYGQIGQHFGWRVSYLVAALLTVGIGALTVAALPATRGDSPLGYRRLLGSLPTLLREEPALRQSCLLQGAAFGTFNMFWATLVFVLTDAPYSYSTGTAGLFGLLGLISAAAVPFIGRLIDGRGTLPVLGVCLSVVICASVAFFIGQSVLGAMVLGVVLLGLGLQGAQSANQTRIFSIRPEATSRINTVFMVSNFGAGGAGGALGALLYGVGGWEAVSLAGLLASSLGLVVWFRIRYKKIRYNKDHGCSRQ